MILILSILKHSSLIMLACLSRITTSWIRETRRRGTCSTSNPPSTSVQFNRPSLMTNTTVAIPTLSITRMLIMRCIRSYKSPYIRDYPRLCLKISTRRGFKLFKTNIALILKQSINSMSNRNSKEEINNFSINSKTKWLITTIKTICKLNLTLMNKMQLIRAI
jgi:hypothetical protein